MLTNDMNNLSGTTLLPKIKVGAGFRKMLIKSRQSYGYEMGMGYIIVKTNVKWKRERGSLYLYINKECTVHSV